MYKKVVVLLFALLFMWPSCAMASGLTVNWQIVRLDDGSTATEMWYNNKIIWRVMILGDGAKPVSSSYDTKTIFIAPDIINGCFKIEVQ